MVETEISHGLYQSIEQGIYNFRYRAIRCLKNPFDLALYSMLISDTRPATIIEWGTYAGASALWLADTCWAQGIQVKIHSFDRMPPPIEDPRIVFHEGNARDPSVACPLEFIEQLARPLFIIEDTDHHFVTTMAVLNHFSPVMREGEYILVEDSLQQVFATRDNNDGGGPAHAIEHFLQKNPDWEIDRRYCDWFGKNATWCADGFLRKKRTSEPAGSKELSIDLGNGRSATERQLSLECRDSDGNLKWTVPYQVWVENE